MKSKSFLALFLFATFFSAIITPVFATTTQQQPPVFAAKQMPTWLAEAGAMPVADAQLELVQGELDLVFASAIIMILLSAPGAATWANGQIVNFNYNQAMSLWLKKMELTMEIWLKCIFNVFATTFAIRKLHGVCYTVFFVNGYYNR